MTIEKFVLKYVLNHPAKPGYPSRVKIFIPKMGSFFNFGRFAHFVTKIDPFRVIKCWPLTDNLTRAHRTAKGKFLEKLQSGGPWLSLIYLRTCLLRTKRRTEGGDNFSKFFQNNLEFLKFLEKWSPPSGQTSEISDPPILPQPFTFTN